MTAMITLKMLIRPERIKKDGTWNVNLRISHNRKTKYIQTPYFVVKGQLDKKHEIKDPFLLKQLADDEMKARRIIHEAHKKLSEMDVNQVATYLTDNLYNQASDNLNFFSFTDSLLEEFENNGKASIGNFRISFNKLKNFLKRDDLNFDELTPHFLSDFDNWLKESGVGIRGRALYLSNIRTAFNIALTKYNDEDSDIILIKRNPFRKFKIPKVPATEYRALSLDQIKAFIEYKCDKETTQLGKDVFLLSFYLVGINSKDLYLLKNTTGERITYNRAKTKNQREDSAKISIKIEDEARQIIEKYKDPAKERLLNFYHRYATAQGFNKYINEYIKPIGKAIGVEDLEFYAARHTWATLFVNECGASESEAGFCLNHVSAHKVTAGYIKKDFTRIDRANRKVIELVRSLV